MNEPMAQNVQGLSDCLPWRRCASRYVVSASALAALEGSEASSEGAEVRVREMPQ
jgi:hypothetical protein